MDDRPTRRPADDRPGSVDADALADRLRAPELDRRASALRTCEALARRDPARVEPVAGPVVAAVAAELDRAFDRSELVTDRPRRSAEAVADGVRALARLAADRPRAVLRAERPEGLDPVSVLVRVTDRATDHGTDDRDDSRVADRQDVADPAGPGPAGGDPAADADPRPGDAWETARRPAVAALARLGEADPDALVGAGDALLRAARADDRALARSGVEGLSRLAAVVPSAAVDAPPALVDHLRTGDPDLVVPAVRCLEALSAELPAAVAPAAPALVDLLAGHVGDGARRRESTVEDAARTVYRLARHDPEALVEAGPALVETLRAARRRSNHTVASAAVITCAHVSRAAPRAVEGAATEAGALLADRPVDVQNRAAVEVLDNVAAAAPEAVVPVPIRLSGPVAATDELLGPALSALASTTERDPGAVRRADVGIVLRALRDGDVARRQAAATILANVSARSPSTVRLATPDDAEDPPGEVADPDAGGPSTEAGDDGTDADPNTDADAAGDAAEDFPALPGEDGLLSDDDPDPFGTPAATTGHDLLLRAVADDDRTVRTRSAEALANLAAAYPDADVYDPVEGHGLGAVVDLLDDAPTAPKFAARVLAEVDLDPTVVDLARDALIEVLSTRSADRETRLAAVDALGNIARQVPADAPAIVETLVADLEAYAPSTATQVVDLLADLAGDHPAAVAPTLPALVERSTAAPITAAAPLGRCLAAVAADRSVRESVDRLADRLGGDGLFEARTLAHLAADRPAAAVPAVPALVELVADAPPAALSPLAVSESRRPPAELLAAVAEDPVSAEDVPGYAVRTLAAITDAAPEAVADHADRIATLVGEADTPRLRALGVVLLGHVARSHPPAVEDHVDALQELLAADDDLELRWYVVRIVGLAAEDSPDAVKRVVHELVEDLQGTGVDLESDVDPHYVINEDTRRAERVIEWLADTAQRTPEAVRPATDVLVRILDGLAQRIVASDDPDVPALVEPAVRTLAAVAREDPAAVVPAAEVLGSLARFEDPAVAAPAARGVAALADHDPETVTPMAGGLAELIAGDRMESFPHLLPDVDDPDDARFAGVAFGAARRESGFEHPYRDWKQTEHVYDLATESPWLVRVVAESPAHSYYLRLGDASGEHADYDHHLEDEIELTGTDLEGLDRVTVLASRSPHAASQSYTSHTIQFEYAVRVVEYGTDPDHPHSPPDGGPPAVVVDTPYEVAAPVLSALASVARESTDPVAAAPDPPSVGRGLAALVRCRDDRIRGPALSVLAETALPPRDPAALETLVAAVPELPDEDRATALAAVADAVEGAAGRPDVRAAVRPLVDRTDGLAPEDRRRVAEALLPVARAAPRALAPAADSLATALADALPDRPAVATPLAELLGHLARGDPAAVTGTVTTLRTALGAGADDSDDSGTVETLPPAGQQAVTTVLVNLLAAEDPSVDEPCLRALAAVLAGDTDPVAAWQAAAAVRAAVADRRPRFGGDAADALVPALVAACDRSPVDPAALADPLASVPVPDAGELRAAVRTDALVALDELLGDLPADLDLDLTPLATVLAEGPPTAEDPGVAPAERLLSVLETVADSDPARLRPVADELRAFARATPAHRRRAETLLDRLSDSDAPAPS